MDIQVRRNGRGPVIPTRLWDRFEDIVHALRNNNDALADQWCTARAIADLLGKDASEARTIGRILGLLQKYSYLQEGCGLSIDVKRTVRPVKYLIKVVGPYNLDLEQAKARVTEDVMSERQPAEAT